MKSRDIDIRTTLYGVLDAQYQNDTETIIIDEMGVCQGEARIDIAVINGAIHGYEIKSDSDTLVRLPHQSKIYNRVFDCITIVAGYHHMENVCDLVPEWWGIMQAQTNQFNSIDLSIIRHPHENPFVDPFAVVQLLWKDEALDLLKQFNLHKGYSSKPRGVIWERLALNVPLEELQFHVRQKLRARKNWRSGQ